MHVSFLFMSVTMYFPYASDNFEIIAVNKLE